MYQLGIDVGTSSVKFALLLDKNIERTWSKDHHGRLLQTVMEADLHTLADKYLPMTSGGNARYRFAKAVKMGYDSAAVLTLTPRYENAAMVMEMRGLREVVNLPLMQLSFDGDWDESAWSRLRSFLYYC